jgi:SAM-dependent methyltransferase
MEMHHAGSDSDRLMQLVREEMGRLRSLRREGAGTRVTADADSARAARLESLSLPRLEEAGAGLEPQERYRIDDFLRYHDEDFVRNAYRGLLRREPDVAGYTDYLGALRSARLSKTEIIGRIRYSPEGRAQAVPVRGLRVPFALRTLRQLPVVGHLIGIVQYLLRLPNIVRNHERLEAVVFQRDLDLRRRFNASQDMLERHVVGMQQDLAQRDAVRRDELAALGRALMSKADNAGLTRLTNHLLGIVQRKAELAQLAALTGQVESGLRELAANLQLLADAKADRAELEAFSGRVRADMNAFAGRVQALSTGKLDKPELPDALYAGFEDRFRGTREDIMQRVSVYLPLVRDCGAGGGDAPVLDIGCGRGEWLEVLGGSGLLARGVDLNPVMIAECRARGFDVLQADGVDHLRQLPPGSLGALSAIQVIEHIGFNELLALLDEARRVLRPGGLLVLETPNPENLVVGACGFYYDPTHRQPLPPEPMRHVAAARGFTKVEILRLHPATPPGRSQTGSDAWSARIDALLYGPQDYAIVARNPT